MDKQEIIDIRNSMYVTQEKFAQLLGCSIVTINRWENGKSTPSRLYIRELNEMKVNSGSYIRRLEEYEKLGRVCNGTCYGTRDPENSRELSDTIG